jgi:hypothetical protein
MKRGKKEIQKEKERMYLREAYRRYKLSEKLTSAEILLLLNLDETHDFNDQVKLRIEGLKQAEKLYQEKLFVDDLNILLAEDDRMRELMSKEYQELLHLKEQSEKEFKKQEPIVNKTKKEEEKFERSLQTMEMLDLAESGLSHE